MELPTARKRLLLTLMPLLVGFAGSEVLAGRTYTVTYLGAFPGDTGSDASGINNEGDVVGTSENLSTGISRGFLYRGGTLSDAGIQGESTFYRINDSGQIAGRSYAADNPPTFIAKDGRLTALPYLGLPTGLNNKGDVLFYGGATAHADGTQGPSLVLPANAVVGNTTSINSAGQITGTIDILPTYEPHAFVYRNGVMIDIDQILNGHGTIASAVNEAGLVLVNPYSIPGHQLSGPVLYDSKTGVVTPLGSLPGLQGFYGEALNNLGQVAGTAYDSSDHTNHLFLFNQGEVTDLSNLIPASAHWGIFEVTGMNDAGQIIGNIISGQHTAFLLTPVGSSVTTVPEPSTLALLSLASVGIIARRIVGHCRRRGTRASSV